MQFKDDFMELTTNFNTIIDFYRFGVSQGYKHNIYCGHGTTNIEEDILILLFSSLSLPLTLAENKSINQDLLFVAKLTINEQQYLAQQLYSRIIERVPMAYLVQMTFFCGLKFYVDKRVIIPRSPIAELINNQFQPWVDANQVQFILDFCTGSGCIAIACHYAFPEAEIDAIDISEDALAVAATNCRNHHTGDAVNLIRSDCWQNVPDKLYNLIIANPPYVGNSEMLTLPQEYNHEPKLALEAADDGLAIIKDIIKFAANYLADDGILIVEVGNSEEALMEAYPRLPFLWIEFEYGGQGVFLLTKDQLLLV